MFNTIIQALYYFLPAYAANAAPVFFTKFNWCKRLAIPVDFNRKIGGMPVFGITKTWRGIMSGITAGMLIAFIQYLVHELLPWREYLYLTPYSLNGSVMLGFLMGCGEGLGDLVKSFVKRRIGLKSGDASFPLDQTSFIGALLLSFICYIPPSGHIWAILLISPFIPVLANIIAFKAKLKKVWW